MKGGGTVGNLKRRVERMEERCGASRDEETVEIPLGDRNVCRISRRQVAGLLCWLQERNKASGGACNESAVATC